MSGVSFVARLAIELTSPDGPRLGGNVGDGSQADYTLWPFGSLLAPINPGFIEAAESDSQPAPANGGAPAPVPTVLIAAPTATPTPTLATVEPSPSPSATTAPTVEPTATATASPTRTPVPIQAPTVAAPPARTAAPLRPTSTPAQPSATPVTRPEDQPPAPTAAPSATPRPTNVPAPTNPPAPPAPPPPANTPQPTTAPPVVGPPTSTPLPTSTPEPPMPSLAFADEAIAASEDQGEATLVVRLSGSYFRPVTVAYSTIGGSAAPDSDYTSTSGTLTFSPGQVSQTIRIPLRSDGRNEPNETILVQLSGLSNATLGGADIAVVTITDSDPPPTVRFVGRGRAVAESGGSAAFTVELSGAADLAVAVPYTVGGTASIGDPGLGTGDHNLRGGVVVIPAGATSARVRFTIIDDRIDEDDETVQVNLGTPLNADLVDPAVYVVTITDNDTAGVRLSRNSFTLTEGQSDTYTVVLESEPTRGVTVQLRPDGQLGAAPAQLTFTPLSWSRAQTVTLTALDDDVDEQDQHPGRLEHVVVSDDPRYNRIDERAELGVAATIRDNDTAGVLVGATTPLTVSEEPALGNTATYTVALRSQPTAPVTVTLSPVVIGVNAQVETSPQQLVFDETNWRAAQVVTVTAIDDDYDEANTHQGRITHVVTSNDGIYANLPVGSRPADANVNILDDDTAGVALTPGDLALSEAGPNQTGTYTVTLTSRPRQPVTVTLSVTDTAQLSFAPITLTFRADDPTSWSTPRMVTVTATQDRIDEGPDDTPHTRLIAHRASSSDGNFNNLGPVTKTVAITDDDTAGIVLASDTLTIVEGATATYTVTLTSEPTTDVTLNLTSAPAGLITPSLNSLLFTADNWTAPQTVSVQAGDDDVIDGPETATITHTMAPGSDPIYARLGPRVLDVTVTDDDTAGLAFSGDEEITEGEPGAYRVALTSRPSAAVTVTLSLPPGIEGDTTALVFRPDTWAVSQTVTVTATDDEIASGNRQALIVHSLSSADKNFDGAGPFTRTLTVLEDDVVGLALGLPTTQALSESQAPTETATFTVALTSEPTATVTLDLLTPDNQLEVTPAALSFDQITWNVPQIVTVTAINDVVAETNPHTGTIELASTSADLLYKRTWPDRPELEFEIEDNDDAIVIVSPPSSLGTSESGLAVTFQIALTSEPATPVTIPVALSPGAEAELSVDAPWALPLVFDKRNWKTAATVTVRGLDDSAYDGRQPFRVLIGPAESPGSGYDRLAPDLPTLDLWNDDDEPALASVEDASPVYEGDAGDVVTATFTVTLRRPATVTTTVSYETYDLTASEPDDYTTTTGAITFTPGVTTGLIAVPMYGDAAYEADETFGVRLTGISSPGDLSGLEDTHAIGTITNDDPAGLRFELGETFVREGDGVARLVVRLEEAQAAPVTVDYSTLTTGTATAPDDYTATAGTLTFTPGVVTQTIDLAIVDDLAGEDLLETVRVELSGASGIGLSTPSEATVTIVDDDRATPLATPLFLVTGGPAADKTNGYYYTGATDPSGEARGYGYVVLSVPCSWPSARPLSIELWSPAMHLWGSDLEGDDGAPGATTFELYDLGPATLGGSLTPAAGAGGARTYSPSGAFAGWETFYTFDEPTPCGRYALRAEASGDDENYWAVRAGHDADGSPSTPPDTAAGDEHVTMATIHTTVEHRAAEEATTFWFYVAPGSETLLLRNFDLDSGAGGTPRDDQARVSYYAPGDRYDPLGKTGGRAGTPSSVGWGEDLVSGPRAGWWRAVVFTGSPENAYILEALAEGASLPMRLEPPLLPAVGLSLVPSRASAAPGEELSLTLAYQSLGQTTATSSTLTIALPGDLAFDGDPCATAPAGCSWSPDGTLTLAAGDLAPGEAGSHSFGVTVAVGAQGTAAVGLGTDFGDIVGNPFHMSTGAVIEVQE